MVSAFSRTVLAVFWVLLMIAMIIYIFGLAMMEGVQSYLLTEGVAAAAAAAQAAARGVGGSVLVCWRSIGWRPGRAQASATPWAPATLWVASSGDHMGSSLLVWPARTDDLMSRP